MIRFVLALALTLSAIGCAHRENESDAYWRGVADGVGQILK